jgi:hypothetical protein
MESWAKIAKRIKLECPTGIVNRPSEADLVRYEIEAGFKHIKCINDIEIMKSCGKLLCFQYPGDRPGEDV